MERKDPLYLKPWLAEDVAQDLILLENQLPFFVLEGLYNLATSKYAGLPSFLEISFKYFEDLNPLKIEPEGVSVRHFTDLLRIYYSSPSQRLKKRSPIGTILEHLYKTESHLRNIVAFEQAHFSVETYISNYLKLNEFYGKPMNKWKAGFIHDYFNTSVKTATSINAIVLIVLTFVQTVCSIYPLVQGN
ncbi:hypothetical protein L6164_013048 [Bauhinia variegata]|uniref:Uncharacterized protein n=1 Tax=Bauhinia variegata TaxID=167791 RepID=A0ACB9PHD8_BAUVA|nr:hypothetical protein L6164_013048 [Bauhinia variegata]